MKWKKLGHVFQTNRQSEWMSSHAQCPTAILLEDRIRVFFSARLKSQQSLPTFIDVERDNPQKIIEVNSNPVLERGRNGSFDENGIIPSYLIWRDKLLYFYYAGWSQCRNVPYKNFTGLAISSDQGRTFKRFSEGPCLGMNQFDFLSATGPCLIKDNDQYICIYSTGTDWINVKGKQEHTYLMTYATTKDGVNFIPSGKIILQPKDEFQAHCKPTIIKLNGTFHMWFSKRGSINFRSPGESSYRLGYASSKNMFDWHRNDDSVGIDVSSTGWDSEMICYPHTLKVGNQFYMFYNGNGFGESGFGVALLEY